MHPEVYEINVLKHKIINFLHSLSLLGGMIMLLGLLGWIFAGPGGVRWVTVMTIVSLVISPHLSPRIILRWYNAKPLSPLEAPALYSILRKLVQRTGLPSIPTIYLVPTKMLNAFATGRPNKSAIALTDGLLKTLNIRELSCVLAHEVSHLKHNDLWIMNLSDTISRVTSFFSMAGQFMLLLNFPLLLSSGYSISWTGILALIFAPTITMFLQLALSRTREFDADLGAAVLTGDPKGLVSALSKMEIYQGGWLARIFLPGHREPQPSVLRTHPQTQERIKRLLTLMPDKQLHGRLDNLFKNGTNDFSTPVSVHPPPRWRFGGIWY